MKCLVKFIETERRMVCVQGLGREKNEEVFINGHRVSVWEDELLWDQRWWWVYNANVLNSTELQILRCLKINKMFKILKWLPLWYVYITVIQKKKNNWAVILNEEFVWYVDYISIKLLNIDKHGMHESKNVKLATMS